MSTAEKIAKYPKTEFFEVVDTIGVPHPFTIGSRHVAHAADHFMGCLGEEAIKDLEKKLGRPSCQATGCNLKYQEHEQALVVAVKKKGDEDLKAYLQSIVKQCEDDGFAGFVLLDKSNEKVPG